MTSFAFIITTNILAAMGIIAMFVPRLPAAIVSYVALICAHFAGATYVDSKTIIFWSLATLIVLGLRFLQPESVVMTRKGHAYVAIGAITGAILGYATTATASSIIIGSAIASFFGGTIYMRTPASQRYAINSPQFLEFIAAKSLPAIVTVSMCAISVASVIS